MSKKTENESGKNPFDVEKFAKDQNLCTELSNFLDVGNIQLCLTTQYTNLPSLNLKNVVHFASCSFSGPIAIAFPQTSSKWMVSIRTCSGKVLKHNLEVPDAFSIHWTRGHCLVVLDRKGHAAIYSSLGEHLTDIYFSNHVKEVMSSKIFSTSRGDSGIAILDDECRVFVVNSASEPVVWTINSPIKDIPTAWAAFQPHSQLTHILLIFGAQFYMGMQGEQFMIQPQASSWVESGEKYLQCVIDDARSRIALLTSGSKIQIVSIDLDTLFTSVQVDGYNISECLLFGWMSTSAIFAQISPTQIIFINVKSTNMDIQKAHVYEKIGGFSKIGIEQDGIRIFENSKVEFVSISSNEQRSVLNIASSKDGALLYEASKHLEGPLGHQSFEYASQVQDMHGAIEECLAAACDSWNPDLQKSLLKAARYGMAFTTSSIDTSKMKRAIREIRVLNEVHASRTGIPITHRQFKSIGETVLINRLVDMGSYSVSVRVAQWLGGETSENVDRVLMEWVRRAIKKASGSEERFERKAIEALEEKISAKLLQFPHISIADAAKRAIDAKLPQLARLFIKRETDDSAHVSVLLQLDDVPAALERAAAAQRPQLIHQVVRHLMSSQRRADYELAIRKIPLAQCLYQDLVKQEGENGRGVSGRQMLALLEQASDFERQTLFHFDVAEIERNPSERLNALRRAKDAAKSMGDKSIEEILNDVTSFAPLQIQRGQADYSVRDTVIEIAHDAEKVAQLKHQARLTDKQVFLWTLEGLAKKGKMEQLFDMAQKKSPVGYAPFIKACVRYKRFDEVKKYMAKVNGYSDLIAANIAMKNFAEAAKMAYDRRDREMLHSIFLKSHEDKLQYEKCATIWRSA